MSSIQSFPQFGNAALGGAPAGGPDLSALLGGAGGPAAAPAPAPAPSFAPPTAAPGAPMFGCADEAPQFGQGQNLNTLA